MDEIDFKVRREIQELKNEVRMLRRAVEAGLAIAALAAMVIFPDFLTLAVIIGGSVLFAFLVSPVRRLIFTSLFLKKDSHKNDA